MQTASCGASTRLTSTNRLLEFQPRQVLDMESDQQPNIGPLGHAAGGRRPIDSEVAALAARARAVPSRPLTQLTVAEVREQRAARMRRTRAVRGPQVADVRDVEMRAPDRVVRGRLYTPEEAVGVIIYLHGGGWVTGAVEDWDLFARSFTVAAGATLLFVDYRLAPEWPFPAAVDDASLALAWASTHFDEPLIVAGDSSGGNLAAVCARRARDAGCPAIALQVLAYPVTDHDFTTSSYTEQADAWPLDRAAMEWFWNQYIPDPMQRDDPDASPLRASDFTGLPPAIVVVPHHDPLRDEALAYARELKHARVPVTVVEYPTQPHGFLAMLTELDSARVALAEVGDLIRLAVRDWCISRKVRSGS